MRSHGGRLRIGQVSTHLGITETFYWFAGITSLIATAVVISALVERDH